MVTSNFPWKSLVSTPLRAAEGTCVECAGTEGDRNLDLEPPVTEPHAGAGSAVPGASVGVTLSGCVTSFPLSPRLVPACRPPASLQLPRARPFSPVSRPPWGAQLLCALMSVTGCRPCCGPPRVTSPGTQLSSCAQMAGYSSSRTEPTTSTGQGWISTHPSPPPACRDGQRPAWRAQSEHE